MRRSGRRPRQNTIDVSRMFVYSRAALLEAWREADVASRTVLALSHCLEVTHGRSLGVTTCRRLLASSLKSPSTDEPTAHSKRTPFTASEISEKETVSSNKQTIAHDGLSIGAVPSFYRASAYATPPHRHSHRGGGLTWRSRSGNSATPWGSGGVAELPQLFDGRAQYQGAVAPCPFVGVMPRSVFARSIVRHL
jgi:hypothetical protein